MISGISKNISIIIHFHASENNKSIKIEYNKMHEELIAAQEAKNLIHHHVYHRDWKELVDLIKQKNKIKESL